MEKNDRKKKKKKSLRLFRRIKYIFFKIIKSKKSPEFNARGVALGTFVSMLPVMGFHMGISIILAPFFKANAFIASVMVWITNPYTFIPIYLFNYKIGAAIFGLQETFVEAFIRRLGTFSVRNPKDLIDFFIEFQKHFWTLTIGCVIVGIIIGFISYIISLKMFQYYRKRKIYKLYEKRNYK